MKDKEGGIQVVVEGLKEGREVKGRIQGVT